MSFAARSASNTISPGPVAHTNEGVGDWTTLPAKRTSRFADWIATQPESQNVTDLRPATFEDRFETASRLITPMKEVKALNNRDVARMGLPLGRTTMLAR